MIGSVLGEIKALGVRPKIDDFGKECSSPRFVERFIEVKGPSASRGKVLLHGNELESARKRRERFYVYRVFEAGDGTFEVAVLSDPLGGPTRVAHEVDVFQDSRTDTYSVLLQ